MSLVANFWHSTIGKKVVMAFSGLIGLGYVIAHMIGNLQAFQGAEKIDGYAAMLHGPLKSVVILARIVLLAAVVLHVVAAYQLTMRSRAARPVGYASRAPQVSTFASRTLRWGGVLLLVFIIFHILHFTIGTVHPDFQDIKPYHNIVVGFQQKWVAIFYVIAMAALGMHLFHGAWSSMRTLGLVKPSADPLKRTLPIVLAVAVSAGFAAVPLYFGFLK
jgi:succinate dehydrogenase / fumarate reductase, cytochrome b subunit